MAPNGPLVFCYSHSYTQENTAAGNDIEYHFDKAREFGNKNKMEPALEELNTAMEIAFKNNDQKALIDTYHKFAILYLRLQRMIVRNIMLTDQNPF